MGQHARLGDRQRQRGGGRMGGRRGSEEIAFQEDGEATGSRARSGDASATEAGHFDAREGCGRQRQAERGGAGKDKTLQNEDDCQGAQDGRTDGDCLATSRTGSSVADEGIRWSCGSNGQPGARRCGGGIRKKKARGGRRQGNSDGV